MTNFECVRRRTDHLLEMLQRLLELIDGYRCGLPGYPIFMQLNRLYGLLRVYFVQQEIGFYPELLASADPAVVGCARCFIAEMGLLAREMDCFARHWSSSASIAGNFDEFRDAASELVLKLAVWFERERHSILPLAEVAPGPQRAAA